MLLSMTRKTADFRRAFSFLVFGLVGTGVCFLSTARAAEKIRVGLSVRNVVFLPFYYAQDKKIFLKNGLDAELIQMRSDLQTVGLISGEIDFTPAIGPAIQGIDEAAATPAPATFRNSRRSTFGLLRVPDRLSI